LEIIDYLGFKENKHELEWTGQRTITQPFQFQAEGRVRTQENVPGSPFVSFQQKVIELQRKTPKRFRKPRFYHFRENRSSFENINTTLAISTTFLFAIDNRFRPTTVTSSSEREEFKACPLARRCLKVMDNLA